MYSVQYAVQAVKIYTYNLLNGHFNCRRNNEVAWIGREPIGCSRDICSKPTADRVHSDQMVLEMIRQGRLVLVMWSEAKSLKTSSRDYQAWVHLDQLVLVMAMREAGPREQRRTHGQHPLKLKPRRTTRLNPLSSDGSVVVRQEAGLVARRPKTLKWELERPLGSQRT
jgi:hypothetical protein